MADIAPRGPEDLVPRPDPTSLTTEQLRRELGGLRELLESKLEAVRVRIDGIDAASVLLRSNLEQIVHPDDVTCLRDLTFLRIDKSDSVTAEKFAKIDTQFIELDRRTSQLKTASDTAIAAAMAAAEKAVGENNRSFSLAVTKSENTTGDSIKSLDNQLKTEIRATNDKVSMLASRQDRNDGSSASLVAVGSGAVAVMALLIAAYAAVVPKNGMPPQPVVQYVPAPTAPASPAPAPAPITVPR